jgi:hypothetical protein
MRIERPVRVARSFTQHMNATADRVFPLLCPVKEAEWIEGWDPAVVVTASGVAELDCVFVTGTGEDAATWSVVRYEPADRIIEFVRFGPGSVLARITIQVRAVDADCCASDIRYQLTALPPGGAAIVDAFSQEHFDAFMQMWQRRLEHYLRTGTMLRARPLPAEG